MTRAPILIALLFLGQPAFSRTRAFTNVDDVQACLPLAGGELLLGTTGGLLHTGADASRLWTALEGLPGTRIHALLREGEQVWIGTDCGLALLELRGMKVRTIAASSPVRAIARHRGALYLGTWGGGVRRLAGSKLVAVDAPPVPDSPEGRARQRITALASGGAALHVGTAGAGLWRVDGDRLRPHAASDGLPGPFVWSLAAGTDHALLVGTLTGLARVEGAAVRLVSSVDARALARGPGGQLLVGTYGAGLARLSDRPSRLVPAQRWTDLPRFVNAVVSAHGVTCVATRDGAWVARGPGAPRRVSWPGPPSNDLSALLSDGARLYVGTFDGGLGYLEGRAWRRLEGVDSRVDALALQRRGRDATLWVGTPRGLYRVRGAAIRRFDTADGLRHRHIHTLVPLRDGSLLAGTGRGAAIVDGDRVTPIAVKQGLPVASVWAAAEDEAGGLWLGTSRGLYHWSRARGRYTRYSATSGHLGDDWVTAVLVHHGQVFVGTYNAGVSRLTRSADGTWTAAQLGGGWVNFNGLLLTGRTLYAASMSGLQRLALADPAARFEEMARAAPGRDVTALAPADRGLWVASRRGLAWLGEESRLE